jgi:hypothetical protein
MPHARGSYAGDAIYKGALDRYRGGGKVGPPDAEGYIVVHSTTNNIWPGFRALDPDPAKAQQWIDKVCIYPYSQREHPPKQRLMMVCWVGDLGARWMLGHTI